MPHIQPETLQRPQLTASFSPGRRERRRGWRGHRWRGANSPRRSEALPWPGSPLTAAWKEQWQNKRAGSGGVTRSEAAITLCQLAPHRQQQAGSGGVPRRKAGITLCHLAPHRQQQAGSGGETRREAAITLCHWTPHNKSGDHADVKQERTRDQ